MMNYQKIKLIIMNNNKLKIKDKEIFKSKDKIHNSLKKLITKTKKKQDKKDYKMMKIMIIQMKIKMKMKMKMRM